MQIHDVRVHPEADRLVAITDEVGLDTLAELWSARPARSPRRGSGR